MTNKKKLKEEYKQQFYGLREIVNGLDPEGLFAAECPEDEYEFEIAEILTLLIKCEDENQLRIGVAKVFNEAFGRRFDATEYDEISKPIWEWWIKNAPPKMRV